MAFQAKVTVDISGLRAYRMMVQGGPAAGALAQVGITRLASAAVMLAGQRNAIKQAEDAAKQQIEQLKKIAGQKPGGMAP